MNKEEKKALKVINARTRRLLDELEIEKEDMSDEPKIAYLMQEIRANKTILNRIDKLQKENEKALAEYMEWQKQELDQKDKIIDLMAETINNHDIDKDICKQMGQKANCNEFEDKEKCKECIKQYFENKANGGKN